MNEKVSEIEGLVVRLRCGDELARGELIAHVYERLRLRARKMLMHYPRVRRLEQEDDVLQNALVRLHRALGAVKLESETHFWNLAARLLHREMYDLSRHHRRGQGANHREELTNQHGPSAEEYSVDDLSGDSGGATPLARSDGEDEGGPLGAIPDPAGDPASLAEWTAFHEHVEALPDEEREVFDLIYYQGLTQEHAAILQGVSTRTVKRRWQSARSVLARALGGLRPTEG